MPPTAQPESLDLILSQVSRLHYTRVHALLETTQLYRGQPPVLFALWEQEGLTHTELADRLHVKPATITKMLQRMEKTGFVTRAPDANDQRISRVHLTKKGRAIRSCVQKIWQRIDQETFAGLTVEERRLLRQLLLKIRDNLVRATGQRLPF